MRGNGYVSIDEMEGHDFEYYCADVLRSNGFSHVTVTRGSGDFGVDILAEKDGKTYAIQCKRFSGNVGNKAVQEALSGKVYYNRDIAIVLTNSYFTQQAIETARRTGVVLWDRRKLLAMMGVAPSRLFFLPNRQRRKTGCFGALIRIFVVLIIIGGIVNLVSDRSAEKKHQEKNDVSDVVAPAAQRDSVSADGKDKKTENEEEINPGSVTVNGVSYVLDGDHFAVFGLADVDLINVIIQDTITGIPVTTICEKAFAEEGIITVRLPKSITEIQNGAFSYCRKLVAINLPEGLEKISKFTFMQCESLQSITLPDSVKIIEASAFSNSALYRINLENVTTIEDNAFSYSFLPSVSLSSNLKELGSRAFEGCRYLASVSIPEGVETIGMECFKNCESLYQLSLPETLSAIGKRCFWGCKVLREIRIPPNVKNLRDSQMFELDLALEVIIIPADCEIPRGEEPFDGCNARIELY